MIEQEDIDHATAYAIALIMPMLRDQVTSMLEQGYTVEQIKLEMREDYTEAVDIK
jgi:cytochrome c-type biogenesis protein CcmH/NrfF